MIDQIKCEGKRDRGRNLVWKFGLKLDGYRIEEWKGMEAGGEHIL